MVRDHMETAEPNGGGLMPRAEEAGGGGRCTPQLVPEVAPPVHASCACAQLHVMLELADWVVVGSVAKRLCLPKSIPGGRRGSREVHFVIML